MIANVINLECIMKYLMSFSVVEKMALLRILTFVNRLLWKTKKLQSNQYYLVYYVVTLFNLKSAQDSKLFVSLF